MDKLPAAYLQAMKDQLGEEYEEFLQSFSQPVYSALRVNRAKVTSEVFQKISPWNLRPVSWIENGFYYEDACTLAKHPHYYAGLYYLQEPSAMTPASRLPVNPGDHVLDLCAAPGGKATELGAKLQGKGFLLANDISNSRAKALLKNLEIQGIPNIFVTSESPDKLVSCYPSYFDKILLDAPCSGEGMFRKEPKMIRHWEEHGPAYYAPIQKELIEQAYQMLKPGGMMLYSTCTFSVKENEEVIAGLLKCHPEVKILDIEPGYEGFAPGIVLDREEQLKKCIHIYPHRMQGEGHFLALLQKGEYRENALPAENQERIKLPSEAAEFLKHCGLDFAGGYFYCQKDQLYYLNEDMIPKKGIRYLRTGLLLGTLAKKRMEPSQALAMALKAEQFDSVIHLESEDERAVRYLKGETLEISDLSSDLARGWQLVCVDGFPLGWGKRTGNQLKNKYYAGWRWQ